MSLHIGVDLGKTTFHLVALGEHGEVVIRKKFSRKQLLPTPRTYAVSGKFPGVTEIQAGSYPLMDTDYRTVRPEFDLALSVLGTVISRTGNERFIVDIGLKEISGERGLPVLKNLEGARLRRRV